MIEWNTRYMYMYMYMNKAHHEKKGKERGEEKKGSYNSLNGLTLQLLQLRKIYLYSPSG